MANLGELLAELRHDRGLKQEELADILHLSKSTISSYERGQQLPPLDKLVCLADFFHVTTDYLLGRCDVSVSPDSLNAELLSCDDRLSLGTLRCVCFSRFIECGTSTA